VDVSDLSVDLLLGLGLAAQAICCIGLVVMRDAYDRLHYAAAGSTVGPLLILAAVLVRQHLSAAGLEAIAAVVILVAAAPVLVTVTARAARSEYRGQVEPSAAERRART
jgi:monovalent cation/proton antiporter MnhG/PhaG subunit